MSLEFPTTLEKPSNIISLPGNFVRPSFEVLYGFDSVVEGLGVSIITATLDANLEDVDLSCTTVTNAVSYEFQRDDNSGFTSPTTLQNTASTTFTDSPTPGSTYYYRVIATDGVDTSTSNTSSIFVTGVFDNTLTFPTIQVFANEADFTGKSYASNYTIVHAKDTDRLYVRESNKWWFYDDNN
jgi:hypothetical protein